MVSTSLFMQKRKIGAESSVITFAIDGQFHTETIILGNPILAPYSTRVRGQLEQSQKSNGKWDEHERANEGVERARFVTRVGIRTEAAAAQV